MPSLSYFEVTGTWEPSATQGAINGSVTFTMLVENNGVLAAPTLDNPAIVVPTVIHTTISNGVLVPVSLLANTPALNVAGNLFYTASFSNVYYSKRGEKTAGLALPAITFAAPTDSTPINLVDVVPAAGLPAIQNPLPSVIAANILDATTLGRQLLMAPDASTARTDIGAAGVPAAGVVKSTGTSLAPAVSGTDYAPPTTGSGLLKGNGSGGFSSATSGTDYAPATSGSSILKAASGGFTNAVSGTDYAPPTTGSALLKGNGSGGFSSATSGTDYAPPTSGSALLKGNGSGGFSAASNTSDYVPWASAGTLPAITGGTYDGITIGGTTAAPSINVTQLKNPAGGTSLSTTQKPWLNQAGFFYGTLTSIGAANYLGITDEVAAGNNAFFMLQVEQTVQTGAVGLRQAIKGHVNVLATGTNTQAQAQYIGIGGRAEIGTNLGGTDLSAANCIGACWGNWSFGVLNAGATNIGGVTGEEIDVTVVSGATVREKKGLLIALAANDAVRGNNDDIALNIANQTTVSNTWKNGIMFGDNQAAGSANPPGGTWPFASDSTMIGVSTPGSAGNPANIGIDFSTVTFTDCAIKTGPAPIQMGAMASAPATPASGKGKLYIASDGSLHYVGASGTDTRLAVA